MKLAIVSDFHLGYERFRSDAFSQAHEALIKAAEQADAMLVPGDIFDNRAPKPDVLAEGLSLFRELSSRKWNAEIEQVTGMSKAYTNAPIVVIPGTHERRAVGEENPISLLSLAGFVVDASDSVAIIKKGDERVAVRGIGGIAEERLRDYLKTAEFKPVPGAFNILMFHQSIYELMPFSKDFIHFDELPEGYDLYVDGHIHNRVEAKVHGKPFIIPGSTVLTQLKETEQESKGFYIYDTKTGEARFQSINSRRFVVVKVSVEGKEPSEITSEISERVAKEAGKGDMPIVQVSLSGSLKQGFKPGDLSFSQIVKDFEGKAIVEISGSGIEEASAIAGAFKQGMLEGLPVKDYGTSLFIEKLKQAGYSLSISPTALFDILSGESKDKAVKAALDKLLQGD
ncbi:MAG: DNA repair exonuclease [Candidatus Micrarchaeia archaeon]